MRTVRESTKNAKMVVGKQHRHSEAKDSERHAGLLDMQQAVGNRNATVMFKRLTVGAARDPFEAEADRVADGVMRMTDTWEPTVTSLGAAESDLQALPIRPLAHGPGRDGGELSTDAERSVTGVLRGGGRPLPTVDRVFLENRMGYDFGAVRIHDGPSAAHANRAVNAQAFTVGAHIALGEGSYEPATASGRRLLAHELTHVVQQGAADARQGAPASTSTPTSAAANRVQRKLGFELEMLVLVDSNGRPLPEKVNLGNVGPRLDLTVDQNAQVESPTPTTAAAANFDLRGAVQGNPPDTMRVDHVTRAYHDDGAGNLTYYDTQGDAQAAHPVLAMGATIQPEAIVNYQSYAAVPAPINALPVLARGEAGMAEFLRPRDFTYVRRGTPRTNVARHPFGPGMGNDRYASILEIVTKPYDPENASGLQNLKSAMADAATFANNINPKVRTQLSAIPNTTAKSPLYHVGNNVSNKQSINASIQTNLGIRISQYAALLDSIADSGNQGLFRLKHSTDTDQTVGRVLERELRDAVGNADAVLAAVGKVKRRTLVPDKAITLESMRGLLTLVAQYLRLGKLAYDPQVAKWALDKNVVANLSRTDLSTIFKGVPGDDQTWVEQNIGTIRNLLKAQTGRTGGRYLFTAPDEMAGGPPPYAAALQLTVDQFLTNVFQGASDGVTPNFGAIRTFEPEVVRPGGFLGVGEKKGPVFEVRNMVAAREVSGRFPPDQWEPLADYFGALLTTLNMRTKHEQSAKTATDLGVDDKSGSGLDQNDQDLGSNVGSNVPFLNARSRLRPTRIAEKKLVL